MLLVESIFLVLTCYVAVYVLYCLCLVFANAAIDESKTSTKRETVFAIIIPAHNEELLLPRLLTSISDQVYRPELFETIVVADNCTDNTETIAMEMGARVLHRTSEEKRGKGYAIQMAVQTIDLTRYDAVLVVDADSVVDKDALAHLGSFISNGYSAIQCFNGVLNPDDSWFTRLVDVSRTIANEIYHPAKHKLRLSSYLMGNGMCFSTAGLRKYGWSAFSIGEDWEYYARLVEMGEKVAFCRKARLYHQESSSLRQATSQRARWSSGRFEILWNYGIRLLFRGILERNIVKVDASLPLIFPNPSMGINITLGLLLYSYLALGSSSVMSLGLTGLAVLQFCIFVLGISYTQNRSMRLASVIVAPLFLTWKCGIDILSAVGMWRTKWVRTARKL